MSDLIKWFIITLSASLEHAKQWGASLLSLANGQPTEFVSLDEVNPSPEDNGRTGDDSPAMSSVESLSDRSSSDVDSVPDQLAAVSEVPEAVNSDTGMDTQVSQEAQPQTPATAAPLPTPTESAAATASQQPPEPAMAPDIAGLTQNLSATDSSTPLGTSSPATGTSHPSEKLLKWRELVSSRHLK